MVFELFKRILERLRLKIEEAIEERKREFARWVLRYVREWLLVARYTFASDWWPIHKVYYSAIVQAWVSQSRYRLERALVEAKAKDFLKRVVAEFVGYPEEEWWFELEPKPKGEGWQLVAEFPALDWMEARIEDKYGVTLVKESERV